MSMNYPVLEQLLEPVSRCFTPDVARQIIALRAAPSLQKQVDELADRCSDGTLSPGEREEYEAIVRAINFIGVLQAKARKQLAEMAA